LGLKGRLNTLKKTAKETLDWVELSKGGALYFDPTSDPAELFLFSAELLRAVRSESPLPEAPPILQTIAGLTNREDREKCFEAVMKGAYTFISFDLERLLEAGEVVPAAHIVRKPPVEEAQPEPPILIGKPPDYLR
jgi:hypothetical protein